MWGGMPQDQRQFSAWPFVDGELPARIREYAWSSTPLGRIESWPQTLRTTVDLALDSPVAAIVLWGPDYIQIYNDRWTTLYPGKHPAALGQPTHECFAELTDALDPVYQRAGQGKGMILQDSLLPVLRQGTMEEAWWDVIYTPVRGESGAVDGIFCTLAETTAKVLAERAHKQSEAIIQASEERQPFLLRLSDSMRILADPEAMARDICRLVVEHLGASQARYDTFEGEPGAEIGVTQGEYTRIGRPNPQPYSHASVGDGLMAMLRAGQTLVLTGIERDPRATAAQREAFRAADSLAAIFVPLLKAGRLLAAFTVHNAASHGWTAGEITLVEDVAERTWAAYEGARAARTLRESEERFRLFVENVREYALVQTDLEGAITSWNPGAERLFRYTNAEIVGRPFVLLLPEEDRHESNLAREMAVLSYGQHNVDTRTLRRKDGTRLWVEWITEPVLDDAGKLRGAAKVMRDESERLRVDQTLRASLAEKEALLGEVHHRVKNNLQIINSLLNLQSRSLTDPNVLTLFNEARNRVQSISEIHQMLYRSSNFASVDLLAYAKELVSHLVRFYYAQARVQTYVEGSGATLELGRAVPFGLLLNELVSNALKHGVPDPETGSIHVEVLEKNGTISLRVKDTGAGFPEGLRPEQGTSLGLNLVHILARQLAATVAFESRAGASVRVSFRSAPNRRGHSS
jgi:PAS domain S-box-containing protein